MLTYASNIPFGGLNMLLSPQEEILSFMVRGWKSLGHVEIDEKTGKTSLN